MTSLKHVFEGRADPFCFPRLLEDSAGEVCIGLGEPSDHGATSEGTGAGLGHVHSGHAPAELLGGKTHQNACTCQNPSFFIFKAG